PRPGNCRVAHLPGQEHSIAVAKGRLENCLQPVVVARGMAGSIMNCQQIFDSTENAIFGGVDRDMANIGTRQLRGLMSSVPLMPNPRFRCTIRRQARDRSVGCEFSAKTSKKWSSDGRYGAGVATAREGDCNRAGGPQAVLNRARVVLPECVFI